MKTSESLFVPHLFCSQSHSQMLAQLAHHQYSSICGRTMWLHYYLRVVGRKGETSGYFSVALLTSFSKRSIFSKSDFITLLLLYVLHFLSPPVFEGYGAQLSCIGVLNMTVCNTGLRKVKVKKINFSFFF